MHALFRSLALNVDFLDSALSQLHMFSHSNIALILWEGMVDEVEN